MHNFMALNLQIALSVVHCDCCFNTCNHLTLCNYFVHNNMQYIDPGDAHKLEQAELVVIDEAAAIPLPLVKKLLAPCLVFMASTVNGYAPGN